LDSEDLFNTFNPLGGLVSAALRTNDDRSSKQCGKLVFASQGDAERAIVEMASQIIGGKRLVVTWWREQKTSAEVCFFTLTKRYEALFNSTESHPHPVSSQKPPPYSNPTLTTISILPTRTSHTGKSRVTCSPKELKVKWEGLTTASTAGTGGIKPVMERRTIRQMGHLSSLLRLRRVRVRAEA